MQSMSMLARQELQKQSSFGGSRPALCQLQRQLLDDQDQDLAELSKTTQRLGQTAQVINQEIISQQKMLEELNEDMDREMEKMDFLTKGMGRLLKTNNTWQIYLIGGMILLFALMLSLIIWT